MQETRDKASAQASSIQYLQENLENVKRDAEYAKTAAEETITARLEEKYREKLVVGYTATGRYSMKPTLWNRLLNES